MRDVSSFKARRDTLESSLLASAIRHAKNCPAGIARSRASVSPINDWPSLFEKLGSCKAPTDGQHTPWSQLQATYAKRKNYVCAVGTINATQCSQRMRQRGFTLRVVMLV